MRKAPWKLFSLFACFAAFAIVFAFAGAADARGFKLKSADVQEAGGAWRIFVTIDLDRAPSTAHVPMKFIFTQQVVFDRSLVDNSKEPVVSRSIVRGGSPNVEGLDVDFANGMGKIWKTTRFDFALTRERGYLAGEYKLEVRTSDGTALGNANITLRGDNDVVDRRTMNFAAKKSDDDAGAHRAQTKFEDPKVEDVKPATTAAPFIPADAYNKTTEEDLRVKPKSGCGCDATGANVLATGWPFAAVLLLARRLGHRFARRRSA